MSDSTKITRKKLEACREQLRANVEVNRLNFLLEKSNRENAHLKSQLVTYRETISQASAFFEWCQNNLKRLEYYGKHWFENVKTEIQRLRSENAQLKAAMRKFAEKEFECTRCGDESSIQTELEYWKAHNCWNDEEQKLADLFWEVIKED